MFLLVIAPVFFSMHSRSIVSRQVKLDEDALRTWNAAFPVTHLRRSFRGDVLNIEVVWLDTFKI